uniref:Uncharacterized protein n=1 Tax=Rhizophora mucronata TaxID=61149 RepID=A0A2P2PRL2_RHIMU
MFCNKQCIPLIWGTRSIFCYPKSCLISGTASENT